MDPRFLGSLAPNYVPPNPAPRVDPQTIGGFNFPFHVPGDGTRVGDFTLRGTVPEFLGSLAPNYVPPNPAPRMDPQTIGGFNFPFHVPGDGTKVGDFTLRGTVPEFYASYTPQPPPPGCEEKAQHVPGPSAAYNQQQNVPSSSLMPPGLPTYGGSFSSAYSPPPYHQLPPWLRPPGFLSPADLLGRPLVPSLGPPFQHRKQYEWGMDFYIRVDRAGCYHTYPNIGGPYEGLHEAENAIERYLDDRRHPEMFAKDDISAVDITVRHYLYLPDGRKRSRMEPINKISDNQRQLVNALVDKYNDDNNFLGDLAYELTEVVCYKSFYEGDLRVWYHHINFTAKAKGAVGCKLFFAEVIFMQGELPVSCLCLVTPSDDGHCFSCSNNGNDLRHPKDVRYAGGHVMQTFRAFDGVKVTPGQCDDGQCDNDILQWEAKEKAREAKFRKTLEGCDWSKPPFVTGGLANVYTTTGTPVWKGGCWRMEDAV
nr:uncharacterized protein LOC127304365 [Lolium perenne]